MNIKVSMIMPVYNVEKYIDKSIQSVINQTFKSFELIIINDGSIDKSGQICDEYANIDKRIKVIHTENKGQAAARNTGVKISSGDYIGFIDSDDFIDSSMIKDLYNSCIENNSDIAIIGLREVDENNVCLREYKPNDINLIEIMKRAYPCNKLIKRELFFKNNLFFVEGKYYEDVELISKLFLKAKKISKVKNVKYNYLKRVGSTTQKRDEKILDNLWAYTSVKQYLIKENLLNQYENEFNECISNFKIYYYNMLYDYPTLFLLKYSIKIIKDFNKVGGIRRNEYIAFIKKHTMFAIKRGAYKIKRDLSNILEIK